MTRSGPVRTTGLPSTSTRAAEPGRDVIVIGTSAGGLAALDLLIGQLHSDLRASIFIVQHMAADSNGDALLHQLRKHDAFECKLAEDGESFEQGTIYIAPPDHHMLVKERTLLVTKGARENRSRPAIDPLFRSAAVTHGPKVIGVVLTGMLDDGTAGMIAIKKCGGITVVQDPADAKYPGMPQSAIDNAEIDHCVPLATMAGLLERLSREPSGKRTAVPKDIQIEAAIAERVLSDVDEVNRLGELVPYNCPNCGGVLWEMDAPDQSRFRCHTGHSFTPSTLFASQSEKIEETLWTALRMFEERKNLLNSIILRNGSTPSESTAQRAKDTQVHIERIRAMLNASTADTAREIKHTRRN
jgi:two-component system, chemotaxis family, protein-glutamate methylesterase/glutaminase